MPLESIPITHARRSRRTRRKVVVSENWLFNSLEVSSATPSPFLARESSLTGASLGQGLAFLIF
jgi:hypothetical protein